VSQATVKLIFFSLLQNIKKISVWLYFFLFFLSFLDAFSEKQKRISFKNSRHTPLKSKLSNGAGKGRCGRPEGAAADRL